jgi:hypothetical protein
MLRHHADVLVCRHRELLAPAIHPGAVARRAGGGCCVASTISIPASMKKCLHATLKCVKSEWAMVNIGEKSTDFAVTPRNSMSIDSSAVITICSEPVGVKIF